MKEKSMMAAGVQLHQNGQIGWGTLMERWINGNRLTLLLFMGMGFLFGRAQILGDMFPFALSYYSVIHYLRRKESSLVALGILLGASSQGMIAFFLIASQLVVYSMLAMGGKRKQPIAVYWYSVVLGGTIFLTRFMQAYIMNSFTYYQLSLALVEALLATVLYYLFTQSLPLVQRKNPLPFTHEELISCVLLMASVMIGLVGLMLGPISLLHVLSRWAVLLFAFIGNGMVGATAGVVVALIISLADVQALPEIGRLAFAGLLAGLIKDAGKLAVSAGFLIGSSLLTFYLQGPINISLLETFLAIFLFVVTPKRWLHHWAGFIPGTIEYKSAKDEETQFARKALLDRVNQLSEVFQHLSRSYLQKRISKQSQQHQSRYETLLDRVTNETCLHCWLRDECWEKNFERTNQMMKQMSQHVEQFKEIKSSAIQPNWIQSCKKVERVLRVMKKAHEEIMKEWQVQERMEQIRQMIAQQFSGISQVMSQFAHSVEREGTVFKRQELSIRESIENLGIQIDDVQILSLTEGEMELAITLPYCDGKEVSRKLIAPLLSQLTGENIIVKEDGCIHPKGTSCTTHFISANTFAITTGYAGVAKAGRMISGDVHSEMNIGRGKVAIAISDGMGNGERAHKMSAEALQLLHDLLRTGLSEQVAIQMTNAILGIRPDDEMFATLDLSYIDLQSGNTRFLKIGSPPSLIIRGDKIISVRAENLPLGIVNQLELEVVEEHLKAGDLLVMMTDGVYELSGWEEAYEAWIQKAIAEVGRSEPQRIADALLEQVVLHHPQLEDDMTILVARVERFSPAWSTIPLPRGLQIEPIRRIS